MPFTFVRELARSRALPALMSLTSTVPGAVPSLFHNSTPFVASKAEKNTVPFTFVR